MTEEALEMEVEVDVEMLVSVLETAVSAEVKDTRRRAVRVMNLRKAMSMSFKVKSRPAQKVQRNEFVNVKSDSTYAADTDSGASNSKRIKE